MKYKETKEFAKDFKKLWRKKFSSLEEDLKVNKKYQIELFHCKEIDNNGIFEISGVGNCDKLRFYKIKKFQCKSLKGRGAKSGIRIIYAYFPEEKRIVFIEIYFKTGSKMNEDKTRIVDFIKNNLS